MSNKTLAQHWVEIVKGFDVAAFATAGGIGPWLAPIAPASVFAALYIMHAQNTFREFAYIGGIAAALGIVVGGAAGSHVAIKRGGPWWLIPIAVHSIEIIVLWQLEVGDATVMQWIGTALSLIAFLVYVSRAAVVTIERDEAIDLDREKDQLAFDRQVELKKLELQHQKDLARIEANKQAKIVNASVKPTVKPTVNQDVNYDIDSALKQAILQRLLDGEGLNISQLALQYGVSRPTVYRRLEELEADGSVHKNGSGWEPNGKVTK